MVKRFAKNAVRLNIQEPNNKNKNNNSNSNNNNSNNNKLKKRIFLLTYIK